MMWETKVLISIMSLFKGKKVEEDKTEEGNSEEQQ